MIMRGQSDEMIRQVIGGNMLWVLRAYQVG